MTATDGLTDDAPNCATCAHPAEHHATLTTYGRCFTNAVGEQVPRVRDVECPCPIYTPTAAPDRFCPECDGVGLTMQFGGPGDCPVCGGTGHT